MTLLDYIVLIVYFAVIGAIGLYIARAQKTTSRYFIADRRIPTWAVAFTLMATMISSGSIVGHPGTVYEKGMILLLGNMTLLFVLLLVAYYIVPFYRRVVKMSAYEYLDLRFGYGGRLYSSLGFVLDRVVDLGVTLVTTAVAVAVMTGWDNYHQMIWVVIVIGAFTALYTCVGGIEAVVYTNAVQGIILIGGGLLILLTLLFAPSAGPPGAVVVEAWEGGKLTLGRFELSWQSLFSEQTVQWLFIFAYLINFGRRYITDQHMVQRYLIARSDKEASRGAIWGAFACVPIWAGFMFIGACLWGYYQLTAQTPPEFGDKIVPYFIANTFPAGLVGLILAAIMAASMSSVSADLNSVSAVLTTDYFSKFLPLSTDKSRLAFGRLMVLVAGAAATAVAIFLIPREGVKPVMERVVTLVAILSGGVLGLFALGFLTRRATRLGCYCGIVACLLFTAWGILTSGGENRLLDLGFNFTMKPIIIGILGHFVLFGVGYLASLLLGGHRPPPDELERLTFYGRHARNALSH